MRKLVTKDQVIEALKTEPLRAGSFFDMFHGSQLETCDVCAIGAVMRKTLGVKTLRSLTFSTSLFDLGSFLCKGYYSKVVGVSISNLLNKKNYWGAPSSYFEKTAGQISDKIYYRVAYLDPAANLHNEEIAVLRKKTISFVRRNFPDKLYMIF